jgi:SAM-dependent methyltransferase
MIERRKGWFRIEGVQDGDRNIADQLRGLGVVEFKDKAVLDLGCAEGLIAKYALLQGAKLVHGLEIVPGHVEVAREQCAEFGDRAKFYRMDLNAFATHDYLIEHYDVVLMLAILHKLRWPFGLLYGIMRFTPEVCVVRLAPGSAGIIRDDRSGRVAYDVPHWFDANGYELEGTGLGHYDEWIGYFRRRR